MSDIVGIAVALLVAGLFRLSLIAVFATACAAQEVASVDSSARGITNGTNDDADLGVVALLSGGRAVCTGTLISPRVVATAGHCIGPADSIFIGSEPDTGLGTEIPIADQRAHPGFDLSTLENDIGLLLLSDEAPPEATPWPLVRRPIDESFVDQPLRLVGFGRTGAIDTEPPRKREGTSVIAEVLEARFRFGPTPSQTCSGDSGGPAFMTIDGQEQLGGVTSSGDPACAERAFDTRIDIHVLDFIDPFLRETAENSASFGDDCVYDAQCTTGRCFANDTGRFCSISCSDDGDCPAAMFCGSGGDAVCEPLPAARATSGCSTSSRGAGQMALLALALVALSLWRRRH